MCVPGCGTGKKVGQAKRCIIGVHRLGHERLVILQIRHLPDDLAFIFDVHSQFGQ